MGGGSSFCVIKGAALQRGTKSRAGVLCGHKPADIINPLTFLIIEDLMYNSGLILGRSLIICFIL